MPEVAAVERDFPGATKQRLASAGIDLDADEKQIGRMERGVASNPDLSSMVSAEGKTLPPTGPRAVQGSLTGRILYVMAGHGWTWSSGTIWHTQRPLTNGMMEDMGNYDQATLFAEMAAPIPPPVARGRRRQR
jgi:hypothetical protein